MNTTQRRILSVLLAVLMVLVLLPSVAAPARADGSGTEADPYIVTADTTAFEDGGYYLVSSDVTNGNRIEVQGTAVLILGEGAKLTAQKGIQLPGGKQLTIKGSGELIATADANYAGIGGSNATNCGDLIIEGGTITATGGQYGAGIGGGVRSSLRATVTIKGGYVTATGGQYAAGIGGGANPNWAGAYCSCDNVVITGGTVVANGSTNAAGIGGGAGGFSNSAADAGDCGSVTITGGHVTATGGYCGIGPGCNSINSSHNGTAGTITLGWTSSLDYIQVSRYVGTVTVVDGQTLTDGENEYSGTLTDEQLSAAAGKMLVPGSLPDGFYLIGPDWTVGAINPANQFSPNPANASEYMLETTLMEGDQIKVVKVASGAIAAWYPDGLDNQYTVDAAHAGSKTIYFKETYNGDWSAFGGYFWIDATQSHSITIADGIAYGTVVSNKETANAGETVTLTVTPKSGYVLKSLSVMNGETAIETTAGANNTYTFTMPDGDVSVSAVFEWSTASSDHTIFTEYIFESGSAGYDNEGPENLIDGSTSTKWCATLGSGLTITFHTEQPILPVGYILTTANDTATSSGRNPTDWTIEGRLNETDEWTTLVAMTGNYSLPAANFTDTEFVLSTMKTCKYFRVTFSKLKEGTTFQLSEFRFFGEYDAVVRITQCAPTCISVGYAQDCWYSYADDAYYADEDCTQPLNRADVEIPATGIHTLEEHPETAPVGNTPGNIRFWKCIHCHKCFTDSEAANEIPESDTIVYGAISYLDETGTEKQTEGAFTIVTADSLVWTEGWWVVTENVTINGRPEVLGEVHLILCDDVTLTATNGVSVTKSANKLTVYSQSLGDRMGALIAGTAESRYAGIGGTRTGTDTSTGGNGPITINGGKITAAGGYEGSGIGAGDNASNCALITINNGSVTATGGQYAAGIGGGGGPYGTSELVNITINGGIVVATGGSGGAGIGGGMDGNVGSITITGGKITANGGSKAAAIGGGKVLNHAGHGGSITISGGNVTAVAASDGVGIGNAPEINDTSRATNIVLSWTNETDSVTSTSYAYDSLTFEKDFKVQGSDPAELASESNIAGKTIVPLAGGLVTVTFLYEQGGTDVFDEINAIPGGIAEDPGAPMKLDYVFDGWYRMNGESVEAFVPGTTVVNEDTTVFAQWTSTVGQTVTYLDAEGIAQSKDSGYTVLNTGRTALTLSAGWYVVKHDVTLNGRATISGDVHLILANGVTLNAPEGIQVSTGNSLSIYQNAVQNEGETVGALISSAPTNAAGIGGYGSGYNDHGDAGLITINGGSITAGAGRNAAAIGGGSYGSGTVVVNRGTVNATGSNNGAGVGGGYYGNGTVTVNGGTVVATSGYNAAAIGGGGDGDGTVTINGGTVNATGGSYAAGIGAGDYSSAEITITGGNVTAQGGYGGAGIGNGYSSTSSSYTVNITITGGTVNATGGQFGAGIGSGVYADASKITISGGVVTATGGQYAAAIGGAANSGGTTSEKGNCGTLVISGGQVTANAGASGVGIGNSVYCTTSGTIELGWTNATDSITATNYKGPVTVTYGKSLVDGENKYYGTLTDEQIAAAAGKTLTPGENPPVPHAVVIADDIEHGAVSSDKEEAYADDTVTLTVTPDETYKLMTLTVTGEDGEIETTAGENNTYTFSMPNCEVTVTAEFELDWEQIPDASFTLAPEAFTLDSFDGEGYMALSIYADTLTLGKLSEGGQYYQAETLHVEYYAGTLKNGDNEIPFKVYRDDHAGNGDSHGCNYDEAGNLGDIAIFVDPAAYDAAPNGVYAGTLDYTTSWLDAGGFIANGPSGSIALTLNVVTRYNVNIDGNIENGTVTASKTKAAAGETVILSCSANAPYSLDTITVMAGETPVELTQTGSQYSFVMPESDVTVSATFIESYPVFVSGTQITGTNKTDVLGDGNVRFDPETSTLTVLSTAGFDPSYSGALIETNIDLTVESPNGPLTLNKTTGGAAVNAYGANLTVNGNVVLNVPNGSGFYVTSTLTINGDLSGTVANDCAVGINGLTVKSVDLNKTSSGSYGLTSYSGSVTVNGDCTITGSASYAVYAIRGFNCTGDVSITNESSAGIFCPAGDIAIGGALSIDAVGKGIDYSTYSSGGFYYITIGGDASITTANGDGIWAPEAKLTVNGDLTVDAGGYAVTAGKGLDVKGDADLTAGNGTALTCYSGPIDIAGKLTASASSTCVNAYGGAMTVGGAVNVEGGGSGLYVTSGAISIGGNTEIKAESSGIFCPGGSLVIDGTLTIEAGGHGVEVHGTGSTISVNGDASITLTSSSYSPYALYCTETGGVEIKGDLTVEGGSVYSIYYVHVTGDTSIENMNGSGIFTPNGRILLDGDVEIASDYTAISFGETVIGGDAYIVCFDEEAIDLAKVSDVPCSLTVEGVLDVSAPYADCAVSVLGDVTVGGDLIIRDAVTGLYTEGAVNVGGNAEILLGAGPVLRSGADDLPPTGIAAIGDVTIVGNVLIAVNEESDNPIVSSVEKAQSLLGVNETVKETDPDGALYFGVISQGKIHVVDGDWDVTATWPLLAAGGIEIPASHTIILPENGTVGIMEELDMSDDYYGVADPEDPSEHVYEVVIVKTAITFEGTVEWNAADVKFKGTTPYVIANGKAQTPRFTVKYKDGTVIDPSNYDYEYRENKQAGTGYLFLTFKNLYCGTARASFKIYLPATTGTTVENVANGIKISWEPVEGAAGYVIYRRAWNLVDDGWTTFERWNNTTALTWTDTTVYAGTRYQYGIKAYFARRADAVTGAMIGGNVGDNFNLGEVGPLKTTVRITTRTLNSVTAGTKQMTVKWGASSVFTGYQIKYATDAKFTKNVKVVKITNPKTAQTVIKSLKTGTTYYVTVRSYHVFAGMTYFGQWSNVKSCKVK